MMISTLRCSTLFFILISVICSLSTTLPLHAQTISESDSLALVALYNSTNGDNWTRNDNWLEGPVSTWYGITIINGRVETIFLENNNLKGNVPASIGDLANLTDIALYANELEGSIPEQIGNLTKLRSINLYQNNLSGNIPGSIGNLVNLNTLWISTNNLEGPIPPEIGNLHNLEWFILSENNLSGEIPDEIGRLTNVRMLNLSVNQLSGPLPKSLGNLINLEELHLIRNKFSGNIPSKLGNLSSLKTLQLDDNQLTGPIPPELGNLSQLEELRLSYNILTGEVPIEVMELPNLISISLNYNSLTNVPKPSNVEKIKTIRLDDNALTFDDILPFIHINGIFYENQAPIDIPDSLHFITGDNYVIDLEIDASVPDNIYNWYRKGALIHTSNENKLVLNNILFEDAGWYYCQISNPQVPDLILYTNILYLSVSYPDGKTIPESDSLALVALYNSTNGDNWTRNDNWLEGPVSTWYGVTVEDGRGRTITLGGNNLEGNIPNQIGDLTGLTNLGLWGNKLIGNIPTSIGNLINLSGLYLYSNDLEGPIPEQIGNLAQLSVLNMYGNELSGSIPGSIGNLANLYILWLQNNDLNGSIPPEIGNLSNLEWLNLSFNRLSGNIPEEIGGLTNLKIFNTAINGLSGPLPKSLGNLTHLEELRLGANILSGNLPPELGNLTNLKKLLFESNQFTGTIPPELGNLSQLEQLRLDHNMLTGEVPIEVMELSNLISISLGINKLTSLPVPSNLDHTISMGLSGNAFTFEDILPYISGNNLSYKEQAVIDIADSLHFTAGDNHVINLGIDASVPDNVYKWIRYSSEPIKITNENKLILNNISLKDAGHYSCIITNPRAPDLILRTNELYISVSLPDGQPVSESDSLALVALYNSTNGDNWTRNDNWLKGPVSMWYGITTEHFRVKEINLNNNNLLGTIPSELVNLTQLTHLYLVNNQINGDIPKDIGKLSELISLQLSRNKLSGTIPPDLANITKLQNLNLGYNELTGNISPEFGKLLKLDLLYLHENQLTGSIPKELGNLMYLDHLFLHNNQLTGNIPKELGNMTNLKWLFLGGNYLTGNIPKEIGNLTQLQILLFHDNLFENIPAEINNLTSLNSLTLSKNRFQSLPHLNNLNQLISFQIDENHFTFKDIIPNISLLDSATFIYSPQDSIGQTETIHLQTGERYTIALGIDSALTTNEHRWFKDSMEIAVTNQNSFTITEVTPSDAGVYTCEVTNPAVDSLTLYSRPVTLIIQAESVPQTITFDSIPSKTYGDESFLLSATSDAGLEVFFEVVSGPVHLSGDTLFITGVGDVTVKAFNEGNDTYLPAAVEQVFSVAKAVQTITFDSIPDKMLEDEPFELSASASSGLQVSFTVEGPALLDGTTLTLTDTGKVSITAAQPGNENYLPAEEVMRSFVVKAATFSLSGKVKTQAGGAAGSGAVILYTPNEADRLTTLQTGVLQTDGSYAFTDLKAGDYSVGVIPDDPAFLTTYLGDVVIRSEATRISIHQNTENQDITPIAKTETLTGNATLSGILILEENNGGNRILTGAAEVEGMPLPEVAVYLINASGDVVAHDVTNAEGKFSFANIPVGSYQFKADYEGMPHDADNFSIEVSDKDMEVTALVAEEGIIRVQELNVVTGTADERTQAPVLLYPNPTEGKFSVLLDMHWVGGSLIIHNMHGQPLVQKVIHSSKLTFDLSQEKAGVYVITLQKGESWQVLRLSKF